VSHDTSMTRPSFHTFCARLTFAAFDVSRAGLDLRQKLFT
jgi:hypothetical protein